MNNVIAVAASRWRFDTESGGRWWYLVTVAGARGGVYEVSIVHEDGRRPLPYGVKRSGRTTRSIGTRAEGRMEVERAAVEAIQ